MNKTLENKINTFLSERRLSTRGGWAEVTTQDIKDLYAIIDLLIKEKCEEDVDGDLPVECKLINRKTHEKFTYSATPYYGISSPKELEEETLEKLDSIEHGLMFNLEKATSDLVHFYKYKVFVQSQKRMRNIN